MKREMDGMVGTEWQVGSADVLCDFNDDVFYHGIQNAEQRVEEKKQEVKQWCLEYDGMGKFFVDELFGQVYFESDDDRVMFELRFG